MDSVIQLDQLSKTYQSGGKIIHAVNQLSLEVTQGQVYGFLGPNGAGKTTTIRMLLDLIYPTSGQAYLFGVPIAEATDVRRNRIGSLVEEATSYPFMTGYNNLRTLAYTNGNIATKRIDTVLDMVGLSSFAKRKTKTYSTGMKQRLGIAAALLNDPDLLILDEPTSGLDPQGIQDMRDLIWHLAQNEGKTIFLSSHLLHEIEQTCDRVAIINSTLIAEGAVSDLIAPRNMVSLTVQPLDKALNIISKEFSAQINGELLDISASYEQIPQIVGMLAIHDLRIYEVIQKRQTLEDYFMEVIHD